MCIYGSVWMLSSYAASILVLDYRREMTNLSGNSGTRQACKLIQLN